MNITVKKILLESEVIRALRSIFDPEVPVNIYDLGLIYGIQIDDQFHVKITMTLTAPNCPVAESLPVDVEMAVRAIDGVDAAEVEIVFDPPWSMDLMSEEAKLELGFL